jgi:hypothetical protein
VPTAAIANSPDAQALALIDVFRRAHTLVLAQVQTAVRRGNLGTEAQRRRQLGIIEAILANLLDPAIRTLVTPATARPYGAGAMAVDATLGLTDRAFEFAGADIAAVRAAIDAMQLRLMDARLSVGRRVDDLFRQVQLEHAAVGVATADTRRDVTRRMVADLQAHGVTAFVDRRGTRWNLERYATMTVRTNTREMVTAGTVNRMAATGTDLIKITRHARSCAICIPYEGRTYSLSGNDRRYPRAQVLPPFHPQCAHVAAPSGVSLDDFEAALIAAQPPAFPG